MELIFIKDGVFYINGLIDFVLLVVCLIAFVMCMKRFLQRKIPFVFLILLSVCIAFASFLGLTNTVLILVASTIIFSLICCTVNLAEFRTYVANSNKAPKVVKTASSRHEIDHIYDRDLFYKTINEAVTYLSKHKIGAILTFERKDNLDKLIKNGSVLNAPVTFELLITIFYPGTRLHDGAVVIRDDSIIAASVYYSPTTKPLVGKYGSRHRAAIGISEICDAITIVVSEETGKISIALDGELESYTVDNFFTAFVNLMSDGLKETGKVDVKR